MHTITNLRQNVSSGCQGALHPQARFRGQLGLKIPAFRSEIAGPTARRWANMQFYLRPSGGQGRYPLHMGIGLLHICAAARFLHGGGRYKLDNLYQPFPCRKIAPKIIRPTRDRKTGIRYNRGNRKSTLQATARKGTR